MASFTTQDGFRLVYEIEGDGPPLLLHLGSGCDSQLWQAAGYLDRLSATHQCILFDHRGHGDSDHPTGRDANHIDRYVADVVALLHHLGIDAVSLWGYSTAMIIAIKIAQEHPDKIKALIGSGVIGRATPEQISAQVPQRVAAYREKGWEWLLAGFDEEEIEAVPHWMKERIRATDVQPVIGWQLARADWNWSPWEAARSVRAPSLFIVGELEDPDDTMREMASSMPNGARVRIPKQGHINAFLASDLVLPYVTEFLSRNSG